VRVEQVYKTDVGPVRIYGHITKQANEYLLMLIKEETEPISQERRNQLINLAAKKFPIPGK